MNKSSKLLVVIVTVFLLVSLSQVECRRTFSSRSSSSGRGNRGKNQPSSGGAFSSWFGGSKSGSGSGSSTGSGSVSKPAPSAAKNWQTASSQASSQSKSNWANPYYKPASAPLPSAPREGSYGWKPTSVSNAKPGSAPYPSSNIGSRGYPVQSGVQTQSNVGGFKPVSNTNYQPSSAHAPGQSTGFGGYQPAPSVPNSGYKPSNTYQPSQGYQPSHSSIPGGYQPAPGLPNTGYKPSNTYQPSHGYQPSHASVPGQPYHSPSAGYHPQPSGYYSSSGGHHAPSYPQQSFSGHYPSQSFPSHGSYGSSVPSYQGNKLFGGSSGNYGYPGGSSWGVPSYGTKKSSGTGKLLTGLAVGAAGGYLTSSLVNSISNPWKYSGYGYGSRYGYDSVGSSYGSGYGLTRDQSAFERGYERGARDRNENNKEAPAPAAVSPPEPEDPTSKWIHCVAFDPQTQQTLINPNCSCTVTTSVDERNGQPLSVHHCTTLNGLVMKPIPVQGGSVVPAPEINGQPPTGVNAPGAVPSYGNAYQNNGGYGGMSGVYLPMPEDQSVTLIKTEGSTVESVPAVPVAGIVEKIVETKAEVNNSTVEQEVLAQNGTNVESSTVGTSDSGSSTKRVTDKETAAGLQGTQETHQSTAQFYGQLQKIVNMGNFVDGL